MKYTVERTIARTDGTTHKSFLMGINPIVWTKDKAEAKTYATKAKANEDIKVLRQSKDGQTAKEKYEVV